MNKILPQSFFARPVLAVAPDLLGKYLVRDGYAPMKITEVEAYDGPADKACHARFGRTARTEVMFGPAGYWYVYLIYGMYDMLNIVTGEEGTRRRYSFAGWMSWTGRVNSLAILISRRRILTAGRRGSGAGCGSLRVVSTFRSRISPARRALVSTTRASGRTSRTGSSSTRKILDMLNSAKLFCWKISRLFGET